MHPSCVGQKGNVKKKVLLLSGGVGGGTLEGREEEGC